METAYEKLDRMMQTTDYTKKRVHARKLTEIEQRWKEITVNDPEEFLFNEV
jgi:hypothetical protein